MSEIEELTLENEYKLEVEKLRLFSVKFNAFVSNAVKAYPCDKTRKLVLLQDLITEILTTSDVHFTDKTKIESIYKLIENEDLTDKKRPSLYGESENGFNMEDVLNPKGELDLMSLCKELGVTD